MLATSLPRTSKTSGVVFECRIHPVSVAMAAKRALAAGGVIVGEDGVLAIEKPEGEIIETGLAAAAVQGDEEQRVFVLALGPSVIDLDIITLMIIKQILKGALGLELVGIVLSPQHLRGIREAHPVATPQHGGILKCVVALLG